MKCLIADSFSRQKNPIKTVVHTAEKPIPKLKNKEVLVRIHAASVNRTDVRIVYGEFSIITPRPPLILGSDFSGTVVAVGKDCRRIKVNDKVFGESPQWKLGAFSEFIVISESLVTHKPTTLTFLEAASLPLSSITSYLALEAGGVRYDQPLRPPLKVLVLGGTSGTGMIGIQLFKHAGATMIACTCSTAHVELASSFGATQVIDYTKQNWWEVLDGQGLDLVYACVGGYDSWKKAHRVLRKGGRYLTLNGDEEKVSPYVAMKLGFSIMNRVFWSFFGYPSYTFVGSFPSRRVLEHIREFVERGIIRTHIDRTYTLDEGVQMLEHSERGHTAGKVCMEVYNANKK